MYHWTHGETVAADVLLRGQEPYLNPTFFYIRAAIYFTVWSLLSWWFRSRSVAQDDNGDERMTRRLQVSSGPSILLFALTVSFAAFDWIMSLDPHWYSTIFGIYYFSGCAVAIYSLLALLSAGLDRAHLLGHMVTVEHFHDLGKMMFAFVAFWAYIAFSQYFLIWYANIPEETLWFLHRWEGSWRQISVVLGVGHFVVPFFFLMPRAVKRSRRAVVPAAVWVLAMHYLDLYWLVMPSLHHHGAHFSPLDLTTLVGVGSVFVAGMGWFMRRDALVPLRDPRLAESISFENQ